MSANPNMQVSDLRFYFADKEKKVPRVSMTVEGYEFIFACDRALRPIRAAGPNSCHEQIKRTAHAFAATEFKRHLTPADPPDAKQLPLFDRLPRAKA